MAAPLRFDGRVVLVTGAGGGLGRDYALQFAERGASVVVNDLGGDFRGVGKGTRAADKVVDEIRAKGGKAVANYDSVEEGDKLVQTALDNFGRIDIVINNAGILRDKSFARISDEDWDLIHKVHMRGTFKVTRAAWPHMRKQNYGRIIMVSSAAGIYGNFGQANYSAAKLGVVGLSKTLAVEGRKNNVFCNTVAPIAGSRMTETVMSPDMVARLKPSYVTPLVLFLCHESCEETGGLFEVGAGWIGKLRWERTEGATVRQKDQDPTPEMVRDNWDAINDWNKTTHPGSNQESTMHMIKVLEDIESSSSVSKRAQEWNGQEMDVELAKSFQPRPTEFEYQTRDAIIYALGVGMSTREEDHLKFLFEGAEDFSVLPSFTVIPAGSAVFGAAVNGIPGLKSDPVKILHGEQYTEVFKPLPPGAKLKNVLRVADVLDKGSGSLTLYDVETFDESGDKVAYNQMAIFCVGYGNFGGKRSSDAMKLCANPPKRSPDASIQEKTHIDQAALYRMSGDLNPLHLDPSFAAMGGFPKPILHGLCTYGFAVRHVLKQYAGNDVSKFRAVKVRFAKPVIPGETLQTDMWKEGNRIFFQTKVVESGNVCISGAYVDLVGSTSDGPQKPVAGGLASDAVFNAMATQLQSRSDLPAKINAVFLWNITKDGQTAAQWTVDLKTAKTGQVYPGEPKGVKTDLTLTLADDLMVGLVSGKVNAQQAFMSGKLKLKGNMMLAQKLGQLFQDQAKL